MSQWEVKYKWEERSLFGQSSKKGDTACFLISGTELDISVMWIISGKYGHRTSNIPPVYIASGEQCFMVSWFTGIGADINAVIFT